MKVMIEEGRGNMLKVPYKLHKIVLMKLITIKI